MEVKINIDETMFKDVLENELKAFSKEELHELVRECIAEALRNNNSLKNLFVTRDSYWGADKPSEVMIAAARSIDLSPAYEEIQDRMVTTLKENHSLLLEKVMLNMMVDGITQSWNFRSNLEMVICDIMATRANSNSY